MYWLLLLWLQRQEEKNYDYGWFIDMELFFSFFFFNVYYVSGNRPYSTHNAVWWIQTFNKWALDSHAKHDLNVLDKWNTKKCSWKGHNYEEVIKQNKSKIRNLRDDYVLGKMHILQQLQLFKVSGSVSSWSCSAWGMKLKIHKDSKKLKLRWNNIPHVMVTLFGILHMDMQKVCHHLLFSSCMHIYNAMLPY